MGEGGFSTCTVPLRWLVVLQLGESRSICIVLYVQRIQVYIQMTGEIRATWTEKLNKMQETRPLPYIHPAPYTVLTRFECRLEDQGFLAR